MNDEFRTKGLYIHHTLSQSKPADFALHCHTKAEVLYFVSGDIQYRIEGRVFNPKPSSVLLIGPHVVHGLKLKSGAPYQRYALHFSPALLSERGQKFMRQCYSRTGCFENADGYGIRLLLDDLLALGRLSDSLLFTDAIGVSLDMLMFKLSLLCGSENRYTSDSAGADIRQIIEYINNNITDDITLNTLSARFYISRQHLSRLFKAATGASVPRYVAYKRISLARRYMREGMTAYEAALACGFSDYSVFYRNYTRILGHSPACDKERVENLNGYV